MNTKLHNAEDFIKQAYPNQKVMFSPSHPNIEAYLCDPKTWIEGGKARGWGDNNTRAEYYTEDSEQREYEDLNEAEYQAHRWLSTRMSNEEETFWSSLP